MAARNERSRATPGCAALPQAFLILLSRVAVRACDSRLRWTGPEAA